MKLHLGCGRHYLDGWVNVDVVPHPKAKNPPDMISAADKIDLPDGCADEIMAIHLFEHMNKHEAIAALREWHRLLKAGGRLVLEMPDLLKCCRNFVANQNDPKNSLFGIYGNHDGEQSPWMWHKYGWTMQTLKPELEKVGFVRIKAGFPEWHGQRNHRDFRVEAIK